MYKWIAHFSNGMKIFRTTSILGSLKDLPMVDVLSNVQFGTDFSFHLSSGHFYKNNEIIGQCDLDIRDGSLIASREYQVELAINAPQIKPVSRLMNTKLGIFKGGNACFVTIHIDNTFEMTVI